MQKGRPHGMFFFVPYHAAAFSLEKMIYKGISNILRLRHLNTLSFVFSFIFIVAFFFSLLYSFLSLAHVYYNNSVKFSSIKELIGCPGPNQPGFFIKLHFLAGRPFCDSFFKRPGRLILGRQTSLYIISPFVS